MQIDLKKPKYVIPLLILPFLCLFFYLWQAHKEKKGEKEVRQEGLQNNIGDASAQVRKQQLSDKLDAYRNTYKEADGYTAVMPIQEEHLAGPALRSAYNLTEQHRLDSIDHALKSKFSTPKNAGKYDQWLPGTKTNGVNKDHFSAEDQALTQALAALNQPKAKNLSFSAGTAVQREKDPMVLFKTQMAYIDSINKANDPAYQREQAKKQALNESAELQKQHLIMPVTKAENEAEGFNTILVKKQQAPIKAIIDENVTGYADSRIRIRLLDDIKAGNHLIRKGTYLYALINGFAGQRVNLVVTSVLIEGSILPVKLSVYDQDGQPGLFVPASAFRDFTKDLTGNSMQGVQIQGSSRTGSQFLMSTFDKVFQSTSSAIAGAIRKNKAKIKYNSPVYLIDQQSTRTAHSTNNP